MTLQLARAAEAIVEALSRVRAALAAAPPQREGLEGWQDISTAPKDGTEIMLICATAYEPTAFEGWWADGGWQHYSRDGDHGEKFSHNGIHVWFPTHWQPKPTWPGPRPYREEQQMILSDERLRELAEFLRTPGSSASWGPKPYDECADAIDELISRRTSSHGKAGVTDAMRDRLERMRDLARTHAKMTNPPVSHEFQADADALEAALASAPPQREGLSDQFMEFVDRWTWGNSVTAEEALSCIQHHPILTNWRKRRALTGKGGE